MAKIILNRTKIAAAKAVEEKKSKALELILEDLKELDAIGLYFNPEHCQPKKNRKGKVTAIILEGWLDSTVTSNVVKFTLDIEEGDNMDPAEVFARVEHRNEPNYDFATDPDYSTEDDEELDDA